MRGFPSRRKSGNNKILPESPETGNFGSLRQSQGNLYQKIKNIFYMASIKIVVPTHYFLNNSTWRRKVSIIS